MLRSKEEWKTAAESLLPSSERIVERNRAITAHYARLYLEHRDIYKWAGMAAFASSQVGVALAFSEMIQTPGRMMGDGSRNNKSEKGFFEDLGGFFAGAAKTLLSMPVSVYEFAAKNILLNDLEEIRKGNNAIYNDIAWAHMAYLEGGLGEIEENVSDNEHEFLLSGFQMIDKGASLLKSGNDLPRAERLIREGNIKLLRHEQINTLGPVFESISPQGCVVVSFGSELNFGEASPPGYASRASFADHFGYFETLAGNKDITKAEHRWQWIEENVLPAWYVVDEGFGTCEGATKCFSSLAAGEPNILQQVSHFASTLSFLPELGQQNRK